MRTALLLGTALVAAATATFPARGQVPGVPFGQIHAGCHLAGPSTCQVWVDPILVAVALSTRLAAVNLALNGTTVYAFRTDVSNPPGSTYVLSPVALGFAARCGRDYTATLSAGDTSSALIVPVAASGTFQCPAPLLSSGDANGDGGVSMADVFYLIDHLLASGPAPESSGDPNFDGTCSVADVMYLLTYLLRGGPAPQ